MPLYNSLTANEEMENIKARYLDRSNAATDTRHYGVIAACWQLADLGLNKFLNVKFSGNFTLLNGKTVALKTCRINSWTNNDGMWGFDNLEPWGFDNLICVTMDQSYQEVNYYMFTSQEVKTYAIIKPNGKYNLKFYIEEDMKAIWAKEARNSWNKI